MLTRMYIFQQIFRNRQKSYSRHSLLDLADLQDQGCARFPETLQNFSECQILWSLCSVVFFCFNIEIAYSNFTFCGDWTPSFFEFTWKLFKFQQNEHTLELAELVIVKNSTNTMERSALSTCYFFLLVKCYITHEECQSFNLVALRKWLHLKKI